MTSKLLPLLLIACTLFLSACDTTADYDRALDQWIGRDQATLVRTWGPPETEDASGPHLKTLTYTKTRMLQYPDPAIPCTPTVHGNPRNGTAVVVDNCLNQPPPIQLPLTCETVFTVKNGKVTSWKHKGNICRS